MKKLLIIDTSAIMYRSHYAMANLVNSNDMHTGAILGFVKELEKNIKAIEPDYAAAALDIKRAELVRVKKFAEYKGNRKSMPDELREQVPYIKEILDAYDIKTISIDGYEADDVIGSLTTFARENDLEAHIVTGDKDIQQLITDDERVIIHFLGKDLVIRNSIEVKEYINVLPTQIPDFFGLKGDASDGIPGVKGIGDVGGTKLINTYGNLEGIYEHIDEIKGATKKKLEESKELAFISRELAVIHTNLDLNVTKEDLNLGKRDTNKLRQIYETLEIRSLYSTLEEVKEEKKEEVIVPIKMVSLDGLNQVIEKSDIISLYTDENDDHIHICDGKTIYSTDKVDLSLVNPNSNFILFDAKKYMHEGLKLKDNFFDILIAAYIINTQGNLEIEDTIAYFLGTTFKKYTKTELKKASIDELREKASNISLSIYNMYGILKTKLKHIDEKNTYEEIEKPLITVLYQMEKEGIKISRERFSKLSKEFTDKLEELTKNIYDLAGEEFNIDSPSQLGVVLFEHMGIKSVKKTKTGYSTDASVLEELSLRGIEIAEYLMEYRGYKKLVSTYVDTLPTYADENDRIHSSFNGTGTATGRLSSNNPNLQNIPTKTSDGTKIRSCFVAGEGKKLVSFDYSQIELRVLAHLSGDTHLIDAYKHDLDLHELTAREIFSIKEGPVTKQERNIAKIINFSVLYGKTPYGLSKELKISMSDAKKYIDAYFNKYSKVQPYLDSIVEDAVNNKYVETLFGTKRFIDGIRSKNSFVFEQAKRMAINTVVQGTAANIIKIVMIKLHELGYKMLVQVHDELIFELDEKIASEESLKIKEIMENTIKFDDVKLKVNYEIADDWGELK